jgi:hypothetical protein
MNRFPHPRRIPSLGNPRRFFARDVPKISTVCLSEAPAEERLQHREPQCLFVAKWMRPNGMGG